MPTASFQAQDIAAAHASLSLLTALIVLLIEKKLISKSDANRITIDSAMALSSGGPINQLAAQILRQLVPSASPSSQTKN